jgi:beta-glucosidase
VTAAVAAAAAADVAIVVGATTSSEGIDRSDLSLGNATNALIAAVCAAQSKSVIVAVVPGAVLTPWAAAAGAVLAMIMPGQVRL